MNKLKRANLNRLLKERKIKATELSRLTGMSTSHISRLRKGTNNIGEKTLRRLSEGLGVEIREFYEQYETDTTNENIGSENARYEAEHHRLILRFNNKKWGLDTNKLLVELERSAPSHRDAIFHLLQGYLASLKKTQGSTKETSTN